MTTRVVVLERRTRPFFVSPQRALLLSLASATVMGGRANIPPITGMKTGRRRQFAGLWVERTGRPSPPLLVSWGASAAGGQLGIMRAADRRSHVSVPTFVDPCLALGLPNIQAAPDSPAGPDGGGLGLDRSKCRPQAVQAAHDRQNSTPFQNSKRCVGRAFVGYAPVPRLSRNK